MKPVVLLVALFLPAFTLRGQEPKVRTSFDTSKEIYTGQRGVLVVELLAPGFFAGTAAFDFPNPPGLLLAPPSDHPVISSITDDGVSYTVQRHEVSVFARRGGDQTIPPFKVRFSYKRQPLDKESVAAAILTSSVHFTAIVPPGAEKLGSILSARGLTALEKWQPEPGKAKVGDAFTRTVTFAAPGVPAMAFPPFPVPEVDGLGFYPRAPEVVDQAERGEIRGERHDTVTCVCQRAGTFVIPAVRLTWFDLDSEKLQTIDFAARTLEVAPNPAMSAVKAPVSAPLRREPGILDFLLQVLVPAGLITAFIRWKGRAVADFIHRSFSANHLAPLNPAPVAPEADPDPNNVRHKSAAGFSP